MSKFVKVLTAVSMAVTLAVSAVPVSVCAEEKNAEPYTLEQLFAMSDEEFLKLESAKGLYDERLTDVYSPVGPVITASASHWLDGDNGEYTRGETEKKLTELLGDTVEYEFTDPIDYAAKINAQCMPEGYHTEEDLIDYYSVFKIYFPDFYRDADDDTPFDSMRFAKCRYCVDQIIPMKYDVAGVPGGQGVFTSRRGDADRNGTVDLADATLIAKHNIGAASLDSARKLACDMNGDNKIDALDLSVLIENQLGKKIFIIYCKIKTIVI